MSNSFLDFDLEDELFPSNPTPVPVASDGVVKVDKRKTHVPPNKLNKGEPKKCGNPSCTNFLVYNAEKRRTPKKYCSLACNHAHRAMTIPLSATEMPPVSVPNVAFTAKEWEQLKTLAWAHCTATEAARFFHVSRQTLHDRLRAQKDADHPTGWTWTDFSEEYQGEAKAKLRMKLYNMAMDGDSKMSGVAAIFLSKNWLGMGDRTVISQGEPEVKPKSVDEIDAALAEVFQKYNIGDSPKKVN